MPQPSPNPAGARARPTPVDRALVLGLFLAAGLAYGATAAPDIAAEGDGSEYVAAAHVAGIPHAPGFPTYMLLASLLARVAPAEHLARTLNLTSALFGALTVALVALSALRLVRRAFPGGVWSARAAALAAGLLLGLATEFWNQSLSAEVYTPGTALLALCLERWSASTQPGTAARRWSVAALASGLAFGVHYNSGAPAAVLVAAGAWAGRRELGRSGSAQVALAFLLGLSTILYLPLRSLADPALDFGDPETPARLWRMLTLADMPTGKAFLREPALLGRQVALVAGLAAEQWPVWVPALSAAGAIACVVRRELRGAGAALALILGLDYAGILAMANFAPVPEEIYELRFLFLPAYLALALAAGLAVGAALAPLERRARLGPPMVLGALGLALAPWAWTRARALDKSEDRVWREYGQALLGAAEGPAVLFTYGDNAWMPIAYLQLVEGERPDVTLVAAGLLRHPWYRRQLRRRFPELVLEESAPGVAGIARANAGRMNLYHADPRIQGIRGFQEVPSGVLMRLVPEGERVAPRVPPAPRFSPRFAVLDRRERSVRADVLQAYARTAHWCVANGHRERAEEALLQGLELAPPEPRMEEFHLARAGLLLELGVLQAESGRLTEARSAWSRAAEEAPGSRPARLADERLRAFAGGAGS